MVKFGILKEMVLQYLSESYENKDKNKIKELIKEMKQKDFKKIYMFYENFETKQMTDPALVDEYLTEMEKMLKNSINENSDTIQKIYNIVKKTEIGNVHYPFGLLDNLVTETSLDNLEEKVTNRKMIKEYMMRTKTVPTESENVFVENEKLLFTILSNDFNNQYEEMMSEEEMNRFNKIVTMSETELIENFVNKKEDTLQRLESHINSEDLNETIHTIKEKILSEDFEINKLNYLKLIELNDSL